MNIFFSVLPKTGIFFFGQRFKMQIFLKSNHCATKQNTLVCYKVESKCLCEYRQGRKDYRLVTLITNECEIVVFLEVYFLLGCQIPFRDSIETIFTHLFGFWLLFALIKAYKLPYDIICFKPTPTRGAWLIINCGGSSPTSSGNRTQAVFPVRRIRLLRHFDSVE